VTAKSDASRRVNARSIKVHGIVQGVGFRPFVLRLARANTLAGWILNADDGVEIFLEGADNSLDAFLHQLKTAPPPAAQIVNIDVRASEPRGVRDFTIRESHRTDRPTTRISPDLPVCEDCLKELFDPADTRYRYPYMNCTNCGPRYTVTLALPYDRQNTTMSRWPLDDFCVRQYGDAADRRFHAQPVACPSCGPNYFVLQDERVVHGNEASIREAAELLRIGKIVAVKGLGGYHLACDARNFTAIRELRERKYRKEKPFALMARNIDVARAIVELTPEAEALLTSIARPIVIARAKAEVPGVAPGSTELGVMLPYTPLHHLLFRAGAPEILVMTSGNRSSEPIAYEDPDALARLSGIADAFLIGERPIARRVDDSVARAGVFGSTVLRRSRGYAPGAVTTIPTKRPTLAVGADLKSAITLVVEGQAFVSQHIGDLHDYPSLRAFQETIDDLVAMYEVDPDDLLVVSDSHPQYASTAHAEAYPASEHVSVQHHRAHIASVLAERREWNKRVVGVSFDGTGYGDDGTIWGGEFFLGSITGGFERIAHLRRAVLPGGDAAAQYPVQAAAGFLAQLESAPDLTVSPFSFPERYADSCMLLRKGLRSFTTTSIGRLFDAAAALLGFTRAVTFEGQAAMWLEQLARTARSTDAYAFPFDGAELDFRPLLEAVAEDRVGGRRPAEIARAFQRGIARGLASSVVAICENRGIDTAVLSGGVFQNALLLEDIREMFGPTPLAIWTNHEVPPNDGGISLGQAALAALGGFEPQTGGIAHA
jgi:hydrogenase maturation protein HypF